MRKPVLRVFKCIQLQCYGQPLDVAKVLKFGSGRQSIVVFMAWFSFKITSCKLRQVHNHCDRTRDYM